MNRRAGAASRGATQAAPAQAWRRLARNAALLLTAYLYGSLPVVYLLGRQGGVDLRRAGSRNVGGSNLWAMGGALRGVVGWLADASKGLVPIALCRCLGAGDIADLAGVCGVAGQCWPVFLRFEGGRGISAFVGASFMMDRAAWAAALVPLAGGSAWRMGAVLARRPASAVGQVRATRSKSVPLGCLLGVATFALRSRRCARAAYAPLLLALVIVLRRVTATHSDDARCGPAVRRAALLYRLLYDRNTSS